MPKFAPAADQTRYALVLAVALCRRPAPQLTGALNLYSGQRTLTTADAMSRSCATHGFLALATTPGPHAAELHATQLRRAIDSRDIIGRQGNLMNRAWPSRPRRRSTCSVGSRRHEREARDLARTLRSAP